MASGKGGSPGRQAPPSLDILQKALKTKLKKASTHLPEIKVGDKTIPPKEVGVEDVFVNLRILKRKDLDDAVGPASTHGSASEMEKMSYAFSHRARRSKSIPLAQVLRQASRKKRRLPRKDGVRILALGGGGIGKSTSFLKKAGLEWAEGRIWQNMDLVFALPLSQPSVRGAKTLEDLLPLSHYGIHAQSDQEDLYSYMSRNVHRVCVILDGLDEVEMSGCSDYVQGIIKGEELDGVRLIVTSRPSMEVLSLAKAHKFNQRVEVLGFSEADVERYVRKVLDAESGENVMKQVKSSSMLSAYMQTPVNAANACMLARCGVKELPTTLPAIVKSILRQAIVQNESKKAKPEDVHKDWSKIKAHQLEAVMELGAFAFKMLAEKVSVFEKFHFESHRLSDEALSLGLLISCDHDTADCCPQWVFSHLSMQEALAALYIAATVTTKDVAWVVGMLGATSSHLSTFFRFLAAEVDEQGVDALISALLTDASAPDYGTGESEASAAKPPPMADVCPNYPKTLFTASYEELTRLAEDLSSNIDIANAERLADRLLQGVVADGSGTLAVRARIQLGSDFTGISFLRELLVLWKERMPRCSIQMLYRTIADFNASLAEKCFPDLVDEDSIAIEPSSKKSMALEPSSTKIVNLKSDAGKQILLLATHCYQEFCSAHSSTPYLPSIHQAFESTDGDLDFTTAQLTTADCRAIGTVLSRYNDIITEINLEECGIGDALFGQLSSGLLQYHRLRLLNLAGNNLSDKHAEHISSVIQNNCASLLVLCTERNGFTSTGNASLHRNTHLCTNLLGLFTGSSECTDATLNADTICTILTACQQIEWLTLYGYHLDASGVERTCAALASHHLDWLRLEDNNFTAGCIRHLTTILQQQRQHLKWLTLGYKTLTTAGLQELSESLGACTTLEWLDLRETQLLSRSHATLATVVSRLPSLKQLCLSNNDFREEDEGSEALIAALCTSQHLQELRMPVRQLVNTALQSALDAMVVLKPALKLSYVHRTLRVKKNAEESSSELGATLTSAAGDDDSNSDSDEDEDAA